MMGARPDLSAKWGTLLTRAEPEPTNTMHRIVGTRSVVFHKEQLIDGRPK